MDIVSYQVEMKLKPGKDTELPVSIHKQKII